MYKIKFHKLNDSLKHYGRKGMKWGKNIFEALTGKQSNNYKFGFEGNRWAGANPPSHIKVIEPSPQPAQAAPLKRNNVRNLKAIAKVRQSMRPAIRDAKYMATTKINQLKRKQKEEAAKPVARPSKNRPSNVNVNVTDKAENGVTLNSVTKGIGNHDKYSEMARTDARDPEYVAWDKKQTKKAYPYIKKGDYNIDNIRKEYNTGKLLKKYAKLTANSASRHQDLDYQKSYNQSKRTEKEIAYQKYLKKHHPEKAKQRISNK